YILRVLLTRRGCDRPVGMGDVKLLLFLALAVGFPALFGSVALMCVGSLGFYAVQIARGRLSRTDPIPLVPFIALGVGGVAIWQLLI
ncbi:MAG: hypothetical protein KKA73_11405, partial [Chloroflexi bacterium]|nr:hypothetical protein [Chloroflexota bacterium]